VLKRLKVRSKYNIIMWLALDSLVWRRLGLSQREYCCDRKSQSSAIKESGTRGTKFAESTTTLFAGFRLKGLLHFNASTKD
jgi:hypothetical protein